MESLQTQLERVQMDLLSEKANGQQKDQDRINSLESQEASLLQQIMEEQNQQVLEQRVEEDVRDNGYVLDTMEVDGLTAPEIITDDAQYNLIRKGVQILVVGLNTTHLNLINALNSEHGQEIESLKECLQTEKAKSEQLQGDNKDLEVANYQLGLEKDELSEKVTKIAALQYESDQQIAQQKKHIEDLQNQIAVGIRGALNVVEMPQDTSKLAAEIIANKPRITNVKFKDEHGIDRRTKTAIEVLTGEPIEYQEYVEKRYIILNEVEAEQYRADEANKKAELELQQAAIPTIEVPEIQPVSEVVEPVTEIPFQEVSTTDNGDLQGDQGNESLHEVVSEESEVEKDYDIEIVFTLAHLKQLRILEEKVALIESNIHPMAVA